MILAIDTETTGIDFFHGCRPFLVTMCDGEENYHWWGEVNPYTREVFWQEEDIDAIQSILNQADTLVFHNAQFDMRALETIGINIESLWDKVEDTLLASHIFCSGDSHGLKDLAIKYLHYWNDDEEQLEIAVKSARQRVSKLGYKIAKYGDSQSPGLTKATSWWKQDYWLCPDECLYYALCDVEKTWLLWNAFKPALVQDGFWKVYQLRKQLLKICYSVTSAGLHMDRQAATEYVTNLEAKIKKIRKYLSKQLKIKPLFNWNKREHLLYLLHNHLKIPVLYTTPGGSPSADKKAVADYYAYSNSPLLRTVLIGRRIETERRYVQAYYNWLADDSCLHSNLNITGTRETRQSSSNPNQQNIGKKLTKLFLPPQGYVWWDADFANIELRIWAYAVGNKDLISMFERGESVHMFIMTLLFPSEAAAYKKDHKNQVLANRYRDVKGGTFALIYGATEKKADETYGKAGACQIIFKYFPGIAEYTQSLTNQVFSNFYDLKRPFVYTIGGYPLDVPIDEPFKCCNYYIQGSAGIFMSKAMIAIHNLPIYKTSGSQIVQQVHDSLKVQVPINKYIHDTIERLKEAMSMCATDIFGKTPISYEILYNPKDESLLQDIDILPPF